MKFSYSRFTGLPPIKAQNKTNTDDRGEPNPLTGGELVLSNEDTDKQQLKFRNQSKPDERLNRIWLDALMRQKQLYIEFQNQLDENRDGKVIKASIFGRNSEPLPSWMKTIRDGFISATPPCGVTFVELELCVEIVSGCRLLKTVRIDFLRNNQIVLSNPNAAA